MSILDQKKAIATVRIKDKNAVISWYRNLSADEIGEIHNTIKTKIDLALNDWNAETPDYKERDELRARQNKLYAAIAEQYEQKYQISNDEKRIKEAQAKYLKRMEAFFERMDGDTCGVSFYLDHATYAEEEAQKPATVYIGLFIGNHLRSMFLPWDDDWFELLPDDADDDLTLADLKALHGIAGNSESGIMAIDTGVNMTKRSLKTDMLQKTEELKATLSEIDDVKGAKTGELADMQRKIEAMMAEMEAKKESLMAELRKKQAELEEQKEKLEMQIYLLDSQIYNIRCFAGEVVKFKQICSGANAPDDEPVYIHQKLRFLDEDLARLASIYTIQWSELNMFEDLLKYDKRAVDLFTPDARCIALVRLSKSGKLIHESSMVNQFGSVYCNMLDDFDYYHGKTVGILIRNGDNVYLGWTDEDRIHIKDDLIITKNQIHTEISPADEPNTISFRTEEDIKKEEKRNRKQILDGVISRTFVGSILQGVIEHSNMLPMPKGTKLNRESDMVVYVVADKWLSDSRFDMPTLMEKVNAHVQKGDALLTVQHLRPERSSWGWNRDDRWSNQRGRGDRNRTRDCSVADCTIYGANLIEYDDPVSMTRYKYPVPVFDADKHPDAEKYRYSSIQTSRVSCLSDDVILLDEYEEKTRHVYVSVKKTDAYRYEEYVREPTSNFELHNDEFINLSLMNTVWLSTIINTKTLGNWRIDGKTIDYAYGVRYLKTAFDYVRKTEEKEAAFIREAGGEAYMQANPEWAIELSEWKINRGIHNVNSARTAKMFLNSIQSKSEESRK